MIFCRPPSFLDLHFSKDISINNNLPPTTIIPIPLLFSRELAPPFFEKVSPIQQRLQTAETVRDRDTRQQQRYIISPQLAIYRKSSYSNTQIVPKANYCSNIALLSPKTFLCSFLPKCLPLRQQMAPPSSMCQTATESRTLPMTTSAALLLQADP